MSHRTRVLLPVFLTFVSLAQPTTQDASRPAFRGETGLILIPFHLIRGKTYASDLKIGDIVLLEDGRPRTFTSFERPNVSQLRTPLELVLLFQQVSGDVDESLAYSFTRNWDEAMSREILEGDGAGDRISVYHFALTRLHCLCRHTTNPREVLAAFQSVLLAIPADEAIPLSLPTGRSLLLPDEGWSGRPLEGAIATMRDSIAASDPTRRMLVMFSNGVVSTTTTPRDVVDQAAPLGMPIYPVLVNQDKWDHIRELNASRAGIWKKEIDDMGRFRQLGELTGGRAFDCTQDLDSRTLRNILQTVKKDGLTQYAVGFTPIPSSGVPKEHKLEIRLASKSKGKLTGGTRTAVY